MDVLEFVQIFRGILALNLRNQSLLFFCSSMDDKHRISSSYNPHSNTRAELAVKSAKRLMRDFVKADGSFSDRFYQGILQYRNSPQQDVRLSPAQTVFGRQIKDFLPVMGYKYEPWQEWCLIRNEREKGFVKAI